MRGTAVRDEEAVSPVIATVLLLAITVMLSSMVFVLMQGALTTVEKSAPQATVSVRGLDNGFHVVRITSLDQSIDPARLQFDLLPADTTEHLPIAVRFPMPMFTASLAPTSLSTTGMLDILSPKAIISSSIRKPSERTMALGGSGWWTRHPALSSLTWRCLRWLESASNKRHLDL